MGAFWEFLGCLAGRLGVSGGPEGGLGRILGVPWALFGGVLEGKGVILESFWMIKEVFDVFLEKM